MLRAAPGVDETALLEAGSARDRADRARRRRPADDDDDARVLDTAIGPARQVVQLLSMLTALALTLGAVGIYGVIAHFATRRRRDWAIRVALGLTNGRVIAQVIGHGATLVTAGIVIGAVGAAGLTRLLSSFLYRRERHRSRRLRRRGRGAAGASACSRRSSPPGGPA